MPLLDRDPAPEVPDGPRACWSRRTELDLVGQQLRAIEQFNRARHAREAAAAAASRTREMRLDATRSLEVLRREHDAVVARAHAQLRASGGVLHGTGSGGSCWRTAARGSCAASRPGWRTRGCAVVAQLDNGADAVGLLVAEQPDLVLVEDALAMARGEDVVRAAREFAPGTLVGVQRRVAGPRPAAARRRRGRRLRPADPAAVTSPPACSPCSRASRPPRTAVLAAALDLRPALLAGQPALLRAPGRPGRPAHAGRRERRPRAAAGRAGARRPRGSAAGCAARSPRR